MKKKDETLLGIRIPNELKNKLTDHCEENGLKISFFVKKAIQEKLAKDEDVKKKLKSVDVEFTEKIQV